MIDCERQVWLGGLRVVSIDEPSGKDGAGYVMLKPDNDMTGSIKWELDAKMLRRMHIGTRIRLCLDAEYFEEDA